MLRIGLGQLRETGTDFDQYSNHSQRPFPFKSERELINDGEAEDLVPKWGNMDWPGFVPPPRVPSLERERRRIRRGMRDRLWPHAGTWNLNVDPLEGLGQAFKDSRVLGAVAGAGLVGASLLFKQEGLKKLLRNVGYVVLGVTLVDVIRS